MNNLNFKYFGAWNFLCFGPEGIEVDLEKMGRIVLIQGKNYHDINPMTGKPGSNGSGKTTCFSPLIYGLYGRVPQDKINNSELLHKDQKKKLKVEVRWDDYRVVRTRKPDSLRLWHSPENIWDDSTEITCGAGTVETQKKIEAILGMSYKSFVGVTIFDDRNDHAFLEMDGPTKRTVVENLLSLEKYREYGKTAKSCRSESDKVIKSLTTDYERAVMELDYSKTRLKQVSDQQVNWKTTQRNKIESLRQQVIAQQNLMKSSDAGEAMLRYTEAQERIAKLRKEIEDFTATRTKIAMMLGDADSKNESVRKSIEELFVDQRKARNRHEDLDLQVYQKKVAIQEAESLNPGVSCDRCFGEVDPKNAAKFIEVKRKEIAVLQEEMAPLKVISDGKLKEISGLSEKLTQIADLIRSAKTKDSDIATKIRAASQEIPSLERITRPELDKDLAVIEQRVVDLNAHIANGEKELAGPSPYDQIIADSSKEIQTKSADVEKRKRSIAEAERLSPYYKFWVDAFGDDGIRKFVIDGIIPALNSQIAYWLQILIYGNLKLTFDNTLEPTIERVPFDGDPFVYSIMSAGERMRMHLAVLHAFAHVQMLNCGNVPSICVLDEVTGGSIDIAGKQAVFEMIQELSNTRQIFVTTHDSELLDMLQGCEVIKLERRDGITKRVA